jgi:hypothetical protein
MNLFKKIAYKYMQSEKAEDIGSDACMSQRSFTEVGACRPSY